MHKAKAISAARTIRGVLIEKGLDFGIIYASRMSF